MCKVTWTTPKFGFIRYGFCDGLDELPNSGIVRVDLGDIEIRDIPVEQLTKGWYETNDRTN